MRVLVIPTWYPSGADKLMGIYHKEYTEALNKYGVDANMLYIEVERISKPLTYLFMKKKRIDHEYNYDAYIYCMMNWSKIGFKFHLNKYVKKLEEAYLDYIKTNPKPDLIHAQVTVPAGYAACKLGEKYHIPVVVTEHCGNLERFYARDDLKEYGDYVLKHSTFSTVSKYMKDIVLKYTDKCHIIPNIVDTGLFKNDVIRKINGTFKLVSLCALREGKRLDIAFKAIKKLADKGMDIHLDIIGDGFYEDIFKRQAKEFEVEKYVTFMGRLDKKHIPDVFKNEHALLISSEIESFAIPGVEAMASGMPVISTDCLGPTEYVDDKCGVLCKVNDPDDMARAIEEVYKNYSKYDKKYIEERAAKYNDATVVEHAKEIYEEAVKIENKK